MPHHLISGRPCPVGSGASSVAVSRTYHPSRLALPASAAHSREKVLALRRVGRTPSPSGTSERSDRGRPHCRHEMQSKRDGERKFLESTVSLGLVKLRRSRDRDHLRFIDSTLHGVWPAASRTTSALPNHVHSGVGFRMSSLFRWSSSPS